MLCRSLVCVFYSFLWYCDRVILVIGRNTGSGISHTVPGTARDRTKHPAKVPRNALEILHDASVSCPALRTFSDVALQTRPVTDKIYKHGYEILYDVYFKQRSCDTIKLLEIGLGCGMKYGPGASSLIWPRLFPNGEVWFAEFNEKCVEQYWDENLPWRYVTGDQSNKQVLKHWLNTTKGDFDFIIDDGGHTNPQIWNSFQYLFQAALKNGGTYFIEDMHVARMGSWYKGGVHAETSKTIVDAVSDWVDQLVTRREGTPTEKRRKYSTKRYDFHLMKGVARIDCVQDMCAITKQQ